MVGVCIHSAVKAQCVDNWSFNRIRSSMYILISLLHGAYSHKALCRSSYVSLVCRSVRTAEVLRERGIYSTEKEIKSEKEQLKGMF